VREYERRTCLVTGRATLDMVVCYQMKISRMAKVWVNNESEMVGDILLAPSSAESLSTYDPLPDAITTWKHNIFRL
jgi:hypothetical protein